MDQTFKDKYSLSQREEIFLAKKTLIRNIYNTAKIEQVNITFPQTETILKGMSVNGLDMDDVQTVLNLRNAWKWVLANFTEEFSLATAEKINSFVAYNESLEWGVLRNGQVGITGVAYVPKLPVRATIESDIQTIMTNEAFSITEKAIRYMYLAMREQYFWDGNKRTAILSANFLMMHAGVGVLSIPEELLGTWNELLSAYYETNDVLPILSWTYRHCIFGIDYQSKIGD